MAEIHSTVEAARKAIWGDVADAYALLEVSRTSQEEAAVGHLAVSILERLLASWDALEAGINRHGYPSLSDRGIG